MVAMPKAKWTSAEFIDWSLGQPKKYELEQGRVVEQGLTDQVLEDPRHPYTQLLVSSAA